MPSDFVNVQANYLHNFPACNWRILRTVVEILLDKNCPLSSQRRDL